MHSLVFFPLGAAPLRVAWFYALAIGVLFQSPLRFSAVTFFLSTVSGLFRFIQLYVLSAPWQVATFCPPQAPGRAGAESRARFFSES